MGKQNVVIHSKEEIKGIRGAAKITSQVLEEICRYVRPGATTLEIDEFAGKLIKNCGGESAFFNYHGFPAQICISVNDEVVHGIGRLDKVIKIGDIVSLDVGIKLNGFIGDTARTVSVGPPTGKIADLLAITQKSLQLAIETAVCNNTVRDIGEAVHSLVTSAGFSVVRDFVGHGCGVKLHEPPEVPNYPTAKSREKLRPGMVLALEPMVNLGHHKVSIDSDGWTVRTVDGGWSAHFEHMILITEGKPEILTWLTNQ